MKQEHPVILVKRKKLRHHSSMTHGSWKIAYADFMTAMMAFFLVMWLISISSPQVAMQIADYFRTPLKVALNGGKNISISSSVIPGGGADSTQQEGEVKKSPRIETQAQRKEKIKFTAVKNKLESVINKDERFKELRDHLSIDLTNEGLRVQLIDSQRRPMFQLGSAKIEPYMRDLLHAVAPTLNELSNKISISGHTDNLTYAGGERGYSNWELSSDRANASRRELIAGGLSEGKVLRIIGMASVMSSDAPDGNPQDRRISILVLNKETEAAIKHENLASKALETGKTDNLKPSQGQPTIPVTVPAVDNTPVASSLHTQQPAGSSAAPAPSQSQQPADGSAAPPHVTAVPMPANSGL